MPKKKKTISDYDELHKAKLEARRKIERLEIEQCIKRFRELTDPKNIFKDENPKRD